MKVILVVGPSGAGKDTLLRAAREHFAPDQSIGFARRYITRPPGVDEDNYYVDETGFSLLEKAAFFISSWRAHRNCYGVARHEIHQYYGKGSVVASISRSSIADFERACDAPVTILVTAHPEVLEKRLLSRGREPVEKIRERLQRAQEPLNTRNYISFDNSGELPQSKNDFITLIQKLHSRQGRPSNESSRLFCTP
jgi:ribose 1,5-bisphosphokinase